MKIADLPDPVVAVKTNWMPADASLDFTPADASTRAREACRSTVARQASGGYVVEYVSRTIEKPNEGFERDPGYLRDLETRAPLAGHLIAVHRLRPSARSQRSIIGDAAFERLQDMWARKGNRLRWSIAFPIIETFEIEGRPDASLVFGPDIYEQIFRHAANVLRPLDNAGKDALLGLSIIPRPARNAWIGIEDEVEMAAQSDISARTKVEIDRDLGLSALEGMTQEQWSKVRMRAAWLADRFIRDRVKSGKLNCDICNFDPAARVAGTPVKPRSLMDAHHRHPLEEGKRYTTTADFSLLCPICHRLEHALIRVARQDGTPAQATRH